MFRSGIVLSETNAQTSVGPMGHVHTFYVSKALRDKWSEQSESDKGYYQVVGM